MPDKFGSPGDFFTSIIDFQTKASKHALKMFSASIEQSRAYQFYLTGVAKYTTDFSRPFWTALDSAIGRNQENEPEQLIQGFLQFIKFNSELAERGISGSLKAMNDYHQQKTEEAFSAWVNTIFEREGEDIMDFSAKLSKLMEAMVYVYPQAIQDIQSEFGFHFDDGGYTCIAETERFFLYQVLPTEEHVSVREQGKPTVIVPPYVLGANILAFLPQEKKSYVHAFANQGIPTYVRIMKDIDTTPAVQVMAGEDDANDTRYFCELVAAKHGKPVTLNGYCQGGFITLVDLLSGELDECVDAMITCVAPIDGTRSKALGEFLKAIPDHLMGLQYAAKFLPNGNQVVDGKVMSWVYKLKSIESEAPLVTFYRDLMLLEKHLQGQEEIKISKTPAALNYWLMYDQGDLPLKITQMSYDSYTKPITEDGTLPVTLFGRKLNFHRLQEKGIKWLICYAEKDNLIEKDAVLAPSQYIDVEITMFPKGHAAIATSWSRPTSACALHTCFGEKSRGPVRFQLDLEEADDR